MISDVLFDALIQIRRYRDDPVFAACYNDPAMASKLDSLAEVMRGVLVELDAIGPERSELSPLRGKLGYEPVSVPSLNEDDGA
jgi:hypothetical protein